MTRIVDITKRKNGKVIKRKAGDGGCQCDQYCGYKCKRACNKDKQCYWQDGKCYNKETKELGAPMLECMFDTSGEEDYSGGGTGAPPEEFIYYSKKSVPQESNDDEEGDAPGSA